MVQPTTSKQWIMVERRICNVSRISQNNRTLGNPFRKLANLVEYFEVRYNYSCVKREYQQTKMRCDADQLFAQFDKNPSKTNMIALLSFYKTAKIWNAPKYTSFDRGETWRRILLSNEIQYYIECERHFNELMQRATTRFIDICIGLDGLNLDTYTLIFITDHLAEVNKLTMYSRLKIIESVRRFHLLPIR